MHLRRLIVASAFLAAWGLAAPASSQNFAFSDNIDRPGGDYRSFDSYDDAQACRQTCNRERQCRAWTYVKPPTHWHGLQQPPARCWLKTIVPRARANPCCTSGVSGGQRID
ncbi:MAG: PAN domain-containing protein [Bradyrhizobium sp.]